MVDANSNTDQLNKGNGKVQKPLLGTLPAKSAKVINPLEDLLSQARLAYNSYLGVQQQVAAAYKQREEEEIKCFRQVEQSAQAAFDAAIQEALKVRSENEASARQVYDEAMRKASQSYEKSVASALQTCRETVAEQWRASREVMERLWETYQNHGAN